MSMRSTVSDTNKHSVFIYGHDWVIEVSLGYSDDTEVLTPDEAEELARQLVKAAMISRGRKWIYEEAK